MALMGSFSLKLKTKQTLSSVIAYLRGDYISILHAMPEKKRFVCLMDVLIGRSQS